jgi:hypothetical protein
MIARGTHERRFTNSYGEEFVVRVDATGQNGEFLGDETDGEPIAIRDDVIQGDFILAADEFESLAKAWVVP